MKSNKKLLETKIITLGDSHVGKSSLIIKFIENKFSLSYISTVGFDLKYKTLKLDDDEEIKIVIHDTAGQERFKSLAANYIKKAKGILLVYDITDKRSFESLGNWMNDIEEEEVADKVPIILVGNKSDLEEERVISKQEGEKVAKELPSSAIMGLVQAYKNTLSFLDTLEVKEVNIAEMADDYYDALMKEASGWMDEGTMAHCRLAYCIGCRDVLNKIQKGE